MLNLICGIVFGFFACANLYRSEWFSRKRKDAYYDEFVYQLSRLTEEDLEKGIVEFKRCPQMYAKERKVKHF